MPLLDDQIASRENGTVLLRAEPLRLRWELNDLVTADAHRLRGVFTCGVRALGAPSERKMIEEVFLGTRPAAMAQDVADHFRDAFRSAAARVAQTVNAIDCLDDSKKPTLVDALRTAGEAVAFTCGIELLPPFRLELSSPTLERQRSEEIRRAAAERWSSGQAEQLRHAAKLLQHFESLRAAAPNLSPGDVLRQIDPADRPDLLRSLQLASAGKTRTDAVWIVAGSDLLRVDPRENPPKTSAIPLPRELGPLRSVAVDSSDGKHLLLIGASKGVMIVDPNQPDAVELYVDPGLDSPHGFSRVVRWRGGIWACHRDGGLVGWREKTREPVRSFRPDDAGGVVRNLCAIDDSRLLFTADSRLVTYDAEGKTTIIADVGETIAILPVENRIVLVRRDGRLHVFDRSTLETLDESRPSNDVCSAALLPWLGSARILLSPQQGAILCVGLDDPLVTHYASLHHGIQMLSATEDLVASVSSDRQRLILWRSDDGKSPAAELHIAGIAKHRVAGIAVG